MQIPLPAIRQKQKRIAELKAKCEKKGLDFDAEEKKYQEKQAAKQRKAKK